MTAPPTRPHHWRFFRSGGFDQVRIESADDLRHLDELDQKLWAVLACPTAGLELDARTLQLIDADGDGCIRVSELRAAVRWVCAVLRQPEVLFQPAEALPIAAIDEREPEGQMLRAAAHDVLARLGRAGADSLSLADLADPARLFAPDRFNGDGVVPLALAHDVAVQALIGHVLEVQGPVPDRSGEPGVSADTLAAFMASAAKAADWQAQAEAGTSAMRLAWGEQTGAALAAFDAVQAKVQDYFTRCRLAQYDDRAAAALNPAAERYADLAPQALSEAHAAVDQLPLAKVRPGAALPLVEGLNPAWQARITTLQQVVVRPVLGECNELSAAQWQGLADRLTAYRDWLAQRPDTGAADLPLALLRELLQGPAPQALRDLIAQDLACDANADGIAALERLLCYRRDLVTLLRNFVNLSDFYAQQQPAIFQAGTLYIDQRSCELCLRVADMGRHAELAALSGTYLVYCQCIRQGEEPLSIVAAMTGGDVDDMMVPGRNGVFYDRQGRDWNASVVKVVEAPISVRQAFWSPYRRIAKLIGRQIQRFAAARDQSVETQAAARVAAAGNQAEAPGVSPPAAKAQAFDIAKFAGIFAAIGLALGALGTALVALVTGFLGLAWWQMPLALLGVMLVVSGPSMLLAWFKLRRRNVGPLLDANGWAVNTRARINLPFGASLTRMAELPAGAERSLSDPYAEKRSLWPWWLLLAALLAALYGGWRLG